MAVDTESIQTLLKQRRELRDCLAELHSEVLALNLKADTIVAKASPSAFADARPQTAEEGVFAEGVPQSHLPIPDLKRSSTKPDFLKEGLEAKDTRIEKPVKLDPILGSGPIGATVPEIGEGITDNGGSAGAGAGESEGEGEGEGEGLEHAPHKSPELSVPTNNPAKQDNGEIERFPMDTLEKLKDVEDEGLYVRAKLLSDYFSNHPSPVANDVLVRLDRAIKALDPSNTVTHLKEDVGELRDAYRDVASKSYEKLGINGATLVDSRGGIGLLVGVPLFIGSLVLVLFPLVLLLRSMAERMFVADFAHQISYTLTASVGFLWGCVGALSYVAWGAGARAKQGKYSRGSSKDMALRGALGGVFGFLVFLCVVFFSPIEGIMFDMAVGVGAFFSGLVSSIIFAFLYKIIARISGKVK